MSAKQQRRNTVRGDIPVPKHRKWHAELTGDWTQGDIWTTYYNDIDKGEFYIAHKLDAFCGDTEAPATLLSQIIKLYEEAESKEPEAESSTESKASQNTWKLRKWKGNWWITMWDEQQREILDIQVHKLLEMEETDSELLYDQTLPYFEAYFYATQKDRFKCNVCHELLESHQVRNGIERCLGCADVPVTKYCACRGCGVTHPFENLNTDLLCGFCSRFDELQGDPS